MFKTSHIILVFITGGLLIGGFFILNNYPHQEKQAVVIDTLPVVKVAGRVTAINLEPILTDGPARITIVTETNEAVSIDIPSMGILLCEARDNITVPQYVSVGDWVEVSGQLEDGVLVPCVSTDHYFIVYGVVEESDINLKFIYNKGNEGYVLESGISEMSTDPDFITGYILTLETDAVDMANSKEPREGPPTIQVRVYNNPNYESPGSWAESHPLESNIELAFSDNEEATVGGVDAVTYTADGLYASKVYVVSHDKFIYVFTAAYIDESTATLVDFQSILDTVEFIPKSKTLGVTMDTDAEQRVEVFSGVLQVVYTGCLDRGECFATVEGKKVTVLLDSSDDIVGGVVGANSFQELEGYVGELVEVYAKDLGNSNYTLYGSEDFYIKILD